MAERLAGAAEFPGGHLQLCGDASAYTGRGVQRRQRLIVFMIACQSHGHAAVDAAIYLHHHLAYDVRFAHGVLVPFPWYAWKPTTKCFAYPMSMKHVDSCNSVIESVWLKASDIVRHDSCNASWNTGNGRMRKKRR